MIFNAYSDTTDGLCGIALKSAGHIFSRQGRRISRPNGRGDWLLFYIAKGKERFMFDRAVDGEAGSFVLYRPGEPQEHVTQGEGSAEFYYVHFTAPPQFDLFGLESSTVYPAKNSAKARDLFEAIIDELQRKQPYYEKICAAKLLDIMGLLARRAAHCNDPNRRYADQITFVIQRMNRAYQSDETLDDYAALCKMSKFHFLRIFKEITGASPVEYKTRIRMEHARELLEDLSLSVSEVGLRVGYSSPSYFCDAFKKKTGMSPLQYRNLLRKR